MADTCYSKNMVLHGKTDLKKSGFVVDNKKDHVDTNSNIKC